MDFTEEEEEEDEEEDEDSTKRINNDILKRYGHKNF